MPRIKLPGVFEEIDRRMGKGDKPKPSKPPNISRHPAYQDEQERKRKLKKKKEYDDWLHH